jgi:hypothetical protein
LRRLVGMNKILCFVDRKLVEENVFLSELEKATNGMDFDEMIDIQELISTLGYQKVNGVEFEIVDLEDNQLVIYDNGCEDEEKYIFETFEEFMESLEYNIRVAMEYDLEDENIEEMSVELALEYALQTMFLDNNYEYIVNGFTYRIEEGE